MNTKPLFIINTFDAYWHVDSNTFLLKIPVKEQCIVQFPYTALNEDELSLAEGQIVTIISKEVEDKVDLN